MDFCSAIGSLLLGEKIARTSWAPGAWIELDAERNSDLEPNAIMVRVKPRGGDVRMPMRLFTQDIFADDWALVE